MPTNLTLATPDGATTHQLTVPTKWADVTLAQFVARFAPVADEQRRPAEIFCDLPAGGLDDLAADDVVYLANLLAFTEDPADVLALLPTPGLPDIGTQPYGTLLLAQQHIESNPDRAAIAYGPFLLALYRVQLAFGKYDEAKVMACEAALLASPVTEVYADASFFLTSWQNWRKGTPRTPKTMPSPQTTKKKRARSTWRRVLGRWSDLI